MADTPQTGNDSVVFGGSSDQSPLQESLKATKDGMDDFAERRAAMSKKIAELANWFLDGIEQVPPSTGLPEVESGALSYRSLSQDSSEVLEGGMDQGDCIRKNNSLKNNGFSEFQY